MSARGRRHRDAVERAGIEGRKRLSVAMAIAFFADACEPSPSISQICGVARRNRTDVVFTLERLARDGVLAIRHGDRLRDEKSTYELLVPGAPKTHTIEKEKYMSPTKIKSETPPRIPLLEGTDAGVSHGLWRFRAWTTPWLRPLGAVQWPRWEAFREQHVAAVEAYEAVQGGDLAAEVEAAAALLEIVTTTSESLRGNRHEAEAAIEATRARLSPSAVGPGFVSGKSVGEQALLAAPAAAQEAEELADVRHMLAPFREDEHVLREAFGYGLDVSTECLGLGARIRRARAALAA